MFKLSKEKRQEEIIKAFFEGKRFNTRNLSDYYQVDIRVIQKDIKQIKEIIPLQKEGGEYFLPDSYRLQDTQNIHPLAMDMVMAIVYKTLPKYIDIIQDTLDVKRNDIFLFDFEIEEIKNEKLFILLKEAILDKKAIKFNYKFTDHTKNIYPMKITNFNSYWYLVGCDLEDNEKIKTFYLDDIKNVEKYDESFLEKDVIQRLSNIQITSSWYNENPKSTKFILFNEAKKYILRRTPSNIEIISETEDTLEIVFNYFNEIEVVNFIKKWLDNIQIEDRTLREKIKNLLLNSLKRL